MRVRGEKYKSTLSVTSVLDGGWVVNDTPRSLYLQERVPVPIDQQSEWAPGLVWTSAENLTPQWDSILGPYSP
jgi:hypothetical protein